MVSPQLSNFLVLNTQASEDCDRSKESSEYLEILTQQAAVLQNTIDHTQSYTPDISASPLKVCTHLFISNKCLLCVCFFLYLICDYFPPQLSKPSLLAVLHQLSQACGILPIQTR